MALLLSLQRLQSGTTGVCALITGTTLHVAWLGDSQVILVQQGQVVKLMEPHRPERQVRGSLYPSVRHFQDPIMLALCWGPTTGVPTVKWNARSYYWGKVESTGVQKIPGAPSEGRFLCLIIVGRGSHRSPSWVHKQEQGLVP